MHVDDFMIVAVSEPVLDRVIADMNNVFGEVSAVRWRKHDYRGMVFEFTCSDCLCHIFALVCFPLLTTYSAERLLAKTWRVHLLVTTCYLLTLLVLCCQMKFSLYGR